MVDLNMNNWYKKKTAETLKIKDPETPKFHVNKI